MKLSALGVAVGLTVAMAAGSVQAATHPQVTGDCDKCHTENASGNGPKVSPEEPGFFARLFFGAKSFRGHPSVSCLGKAGADGQLSGCHDLGAKTPGLLAVDISGKTTDELCGRCHADSRVLGQHHPSYKTAKKNDKGIPDTPVVPVEGKDVRGRYAPANQVEPLKSHPDSLVLDTLPDGTRKMRVAMPLFTIKDKLKDGTEIVTTNVVGCTTCHNPHFGFLAAYKSQEELNKNLVARQKGDAMLRLRDHDNSLCVACHS